MSERLVSWEYDIKLPPLEPRLFSFNSPYGACPTCDGLGITMQIDPKRLVIDEQKSLRQGALLAFGPRGSPALRGELLPLEKSVDLDAPWAELSASEQAFVFYGSEHPTEQAKSKRSLPAAGYRGVVPRLRERLEATSNDEEGDEAAPLPNPRQFATERACEACAGSRLRPEAHTVLIGGYSYPRLNDLPLAELIGALDDIERGLQSGKAQLAAPLLKTVRQRIGFLIGVGLDYLKLARAVTSLSGGEGQRIRLATQIGSALVGVLYVLDEPSSGLHARDNANLLEALKKLVTKGNTVLLVEHDRDLIRAADHVLDLGPGAGEHGGELVATGSPEQLEEDPRSVTGPYLSFKKRIELPRRTTDGTAGAIAIEGARANNLAGVDATFPLGQLTVVSGVSGSGKSSLVMDTLLDAARQSTEGARVLAGSFDKVEGLEPVDKVIAIDQAPIGRTPRSNPATYSGILALLRELYASLPEARARGYKAGRFSFNVKGGRCEKCRGDGVLRVEMHFLPDMYVPCDACGGERYNRETLDIRYHGKTIAEALRLTVDEASELFASIPKVAQRLAPLRQLGLGYLRLGQPAPTLSGGEAQRLKLASELARSAKEHTLYILDEPTSGLHFADIELLLHALRSLCDKGHTVVVIEHQLEVIAAADWIIDMGPEGGTRGGRVVISGTPSDVASAHDSHTGAALRPLLAILGTAPSAQEKAQPKKKRQRR